jgi:murein L,D-transpeptidase YcbB/YkuD
MEAGETMSRLMGGRRVALALAMAMGPIVAGCGRDGGQSDGGERRRVEYSYGEVAKDWGPDKVTKIGAVPAAELRSAIGQRLAGERPQPLAEDQWKHAQRLYKRWGGGPLWFTDDGLHERRANALITSLLNATSDGLALDRYPLDAITQSLNTLRSTQQPTAQQLAEVDVVLTSAYAALGHDLLTGQVDPRTVSQSWHIDPMDDRVDSALVRALAVERLDTAFARMRPQEADYELLRRELQRYRQVAARGGWPTVPDGKALEPGQPDSPARLQALRARLDAEGVTGNAVSDSTTQSAAASGTASPAPATQQGQAPVQQTQGRRPAASGAVYDRALAGAVAQYQARHGIPADSVLGAETVKSLNVPADYRVRQIAANLERYRWLPRSLGARYIFVNVPAFRLEAYDGGEKALEMKTIVGSEYEDRSTPVFSDSMQFVVFRPYWNVTPDIQRKELEPKVASNPGYMAAHGYEYWTDGGVRRIRQKPGGENSLGLVKFMFPNDFNIYLHDTPQDNLFKKDVRAFSHGCIRLEKPAELAAFVLGWDRAKVDEAMNGSRDDQRVNLPKPIPVYITYFTAYGRDGQLYFGSDVYNRDETMIDAVAGGAMPSAQAVQATQALRALVKEAAE